MPKLARKPSKAAKKPEEKPNPMPNDFEQITAQIRKASELGVCAEIQNMRSFWVRMDATLAKALLPFVVTGRNILKNTLARYVRDLVHGSFKVRLAPILFTDIMQIQDGNHTILAVIKADKIKPGVFIDVLIHINVPVKLLEGLDGGAKRSPADLSKLIDDDPYSSQAARIMRRNWDSLPPAKGSLGHDELQKYYKAHKEGILFAENLFAKRVKDVSGPRVAGPFARACELGYPRTKLERFAAVLYTGESCSEEEHGIVKLRNHFMDQRRDEKGRKDLVDKYAFIEACLFAFLEGKPYEKPVPAETELFPLKDDTENKSMSSQVSADLDKIKKRYAEEKQQWFVAPNPEELLATLRKDRMEPVVTPAEAEETKNVEARFGEFVATNG